MDNAGQRVTVRETRAGGTVVTTVPFPIETNRTYRLDARRQGTDLIVAVDSDEVLTAPLPSMTGHGLGLLVDNAEATFSYPRVREWESADPAPKV